MKKAYIIFIILSLSSGILYYIFTPHLKNKDIELVCKWQGYACGDCYPQFKVYKIISSYDKRNNILNKDIHIKKNINGRYFDIDYGLNKRVPRCMICYTFVVKGSLYYNIWKNEYTLRTKKYRYYIENKECCPKDIFDKSPH